MADELVLLTGATGHIGFRTLRYALEHGYQLRAAVRSEAKADMVRSNPALQSMNKSSQLSFIVVPDITAPGAFDDAVKGVSYIVHIASSIPSHEPEDGDYEKYFVSTAVDGTLGMLESARKAGSVKRVVITSSIVAILPVAAILGMEPSDTINNAECRISEMEGPIPNSIVAYAASKIAALNRAEQWIKTEQPAFDLIHIFPSFVYGRDDLCHRTEDFQSGSNRFPLNIALGRADPQQIAMMPNSYNGVDDCARVHILALNPKVKGNQGFVVSSTGRNGMSWKDTHAIVEKHFPDAVKDGTLPNNGTLGTVVLKIDNSKTEQTFGFKHAGFKDVIVPVIGHYLELLENEKNGSPK